MWAVALMLAGGCLYHVGNPPPSSGLVVGPMLAPVAEPALADDLGDALAGAIRRRGLAGGPQIRGTVESARFDSIAGQDGVISAWSAELSVLFRVDGAPPHEARFSRSMVVASPSVGAAGLDAARREAFAELAGRVALEAVDYFTQKPMPPLPQGEGSRGVQP